MDRIKYFQRSIDFIEDNITEPFDIGDMSSPDFRSEIWVPVAT